jgi:hypothetical protein
LELLLALAPSIAASRMTLAVSVATKPVERTKDLNMLICLSVVRSQTQEGPATVADLAFGENPRDNAVLANALRHSIGGSRACKHQKELAQRINLA